MQHHQGATPKREGAEGNPANVTKRGPEKGLPLQKLLNILSSPVQLQWAVMATLIASAVSFRLCELAALRGVFFGLCAT